MNIEVNKAAFIKAVSNACLVTAKRPVQPILNGVYLDASESTMFLAATDLHRTLIQELTATVTAPGRIVVDAPKDVLKQLKAWPKADKLTIIVNDKQLTFKQGLFSFNAQSLDADDFPNIGTADQLVDNFSADELDTIINRVAFAASSYDYHSILNAVNIKTENGNLDVCATDGSRLVHYQPMNRTSGAGIEKHNLNIPADTFKLLGKVLNLKDKMPAGAGTPWSKCHLYTGKLESGHQGATFEGEGFELTVRLISGDYPRYAKLFPVHQQHYTVAHRDELIAACKAAIAQEPGTMLLRFEGLELKTAGGDSQASMSIQGQTSDSTKFALNGKFLLDFISQFKSDKVEIKREVALKPMIITEHDVRYLIMPVQSK